jgi:uncharacterized protein (DUF433 family)
LGANRSTRVLAPQGEGEPIIAGTRIKVRKNALDLVAHRWDAEEIQRHHPDLALGQVHSAPAYYSDHKEEIDRDIRQQLKTECRERKRADKRARLRVRDSADRQGIVDAMRARQIAAVGAETEDPNVTIALAQEPRDLLIAVASILARSRRLGKGH